MKYVVAILTLLTSSLSMAAVPIEGWYSSLFGGYVYLPNNIKNTNTGAYLSNATYRPGFDAGGSLGFKSTPMRYEGELTYLRANVNKFDADFVKQTGVTGNSSAFFAMVNVFYDFQSVLPSIQPFLGGGIGYGWVNAKLNSTGPTYALGFSGSNCEFSYQGAAGFTYNFAENYALTLGYRYIATLNANELGKFFQANLANVGVVYRFEENRYK